ncbi:DUF4177 domain-containing protein, partial [Dysosmobacter welbionis]
RSAPVHWQRTHHRPDAQPCGPRDICRRTRRGNRPLPAVLWPSQDYIHRPDNPHDRESPHPRWNQEY